MIADIRVRLPVIWTNDDDIANSQLLSLGNHQSDSSTSKITGSVVINLMAVESWHRDKSYTHVSMNSGDFFTIDIDELAFASLWQEFTKSLISNVEYGNPDDKGEEENEEEDEDGDI